MTATGSHAATLCYKAAEHAFSYASGRRWTVNRCSTTKLQSGRERIVTGPHHTAPESTGCLAPCERFARRAACIRSSRSRMRASACSRLRERSAARSPDYFAAPKRPRPALCPGFQVAVPMSDRILIPVPGRGTLALIPRCTRRGRRAEWRSCASCRHGQNTRTAVRRGARGRSTGSYRPLARGHGTVRCVSASQVRPLPALRCAGGSCSLP